MYINMGNAEAENISKYLRTKEILLPSNNKWLLDCINWYKSNFELRNIYQTLQDYVCIQWLLSDLRDVQSRSLPLSCKDGISELTGKHCVQVNWIRDISQPCYTQLQSIKNSNIADSNDNVTAEETKKQSWEPNPKRVLMMEVTDGFTTLKAIEYAPIPRLTEPFIPGFKVVLIGPIECRKGILFLKNNNITILGGEVDYLSDMYSKENILSRCLNIIPPENNNNGSGRNVRPVPPPPPPSPPPPVVNRPQLTFNDVDQLPDSTSFIENNPYEEHNDPMLLDDDDELLCQLPDFNDVDNYDPLPNQPSPVLEEDPVEEVQSSTLENTPDKMSFLNRSTVGSKNLNRPKLFPSMEDLRQSKDAAPIKQILTDVGRSANNSRPESSSNSIASSKRSFNSTTTDYNNIASYTKPLSVRSKSSVEPKSLERASKHENLDDSISNHIDNVLDELGEQNIYPQFKRVNVRVLGITKLKIRNSEWTCCASVSIEDKTENVTFCNKVLEKVFGTTAAEVEVLRGEMAKNQSLKEKVNSILKCGQAKLKHLDCLMTVEYSSEGCTPNIVSVHEK